MRKSLALLLLPLLAVTACDGGGSGGSGGSTGTPPVGNPAPGPTPAPSPSASPIGFPTPAPTSGDFFTRAAAMYALQPDIAACQPGQLNATTSANAVQTLNAIRALHRLPPVVNSPSDEPATQASALMMAANTALSHTPPASWRCYTAVGAAAAGSSNLYAGFGSGLGFLSDEQIFAGWLTEIDNVTADSVGHRRWLLDPFLGSVAYGRVAGRSPSNGRADAASIKVFSTAGPAGPGGALPAYVAYPFEDYPARLFDTNALLSFSVIANARDRWANANVGFANATVTVRPRGGAALAVSNIAFDNDGYGVPNNLQFRVAGLQANTIYDVTIDRVSVNGSQTSYSYWFRIVA
jgi:uncharacterized protein YkwD